jgi:hypothetical protein
MQIINDIINFINNGKISERLVNITEKIGNKELRVVSIKILSWLKAQNKTSNKILLSIKDEYDWCQNLKRCLIYDKNLASIFYIHNNKCDFLPTVNEELRDQIRKTVDNNYNPPLMRK